VVCIGNRRERCVQRVGGLAGVEQQTCQSGVVSLPNVEVVGCGNPVRGFLHVMQGQLKLALPFKQQRAVRFPVSAIESRDATIGHGIQQSGGTGKSSIRRPSMTDLRFRYTEHFLGVGADLKIGYQLGSMRGCLGSIGGGPGEFSLLQQHKKRLLELIGTHWAAGSAMRTFFQSQDGRAQGFFGLSGCIEDFDENASFAQDLDGKPGGVRQMDTTQDIALELL
jgi:hypothetical protein